MTSSEKSARNKYTKRQKQSGPKFPELRTFCYSPGILPPANFFTVVFYHSVCTHHRKRYSVSQNFMQFVFLLLLHFRELVDFYLVLRYLVQDLSKQKQMLTPKNSKEYVNKYIFFIPLKQIARQRVSRILPRKKEKEKGLSNSSPRCHQR